MRRLGRGPPCGKARGLPILTQRAIDRALEGSLSNEQTAMVKALRNEYSLFHWHLEFPEIFSRGGFDLVLGNPPWDALSPDVKEFFSAFDPQVRFQDRDGQRAIVERLLETPQICHGWRDNSRRFYAAVHAFKNGGRYRLFAAGNLGKGDFNIYRMFAETALCNHWSRRLHGTARPRKSGQRRQCCCDPTGAIRPSPARPAHHV